MNSTQRIAAIDITRALTMMLMIFVNDLWTLHNIPSWLEHTEAEADGMGLADAVFPAFLFIVGMSIPYAVANRIRKGDSMLQLLQHVVERSIALLVMGLFFVNGENLNSAATGLSRGAWNSICCVSFILIWNQYPANWPAYTKYILKSIGIAVLAYLAWICRCGHGDDISRFGTHWWGILGLIGWAYFTAAIIFVLGKGRFAVSVGAWIVCLGLAMLTQAELINYPGLVWPILGPIEFGAMPSLVLGGVVASQIFRYYTGNDQWQRVFVALGILAVVLVTLGFAVRPIYEISKIRATPSWVLICSAITIALFLLAFWLCDVQRKAHWFKIIKPAGTDTLLCYLIPYFAYALLYGVFHLALPEALLNGGAGILKCLIFAILCIQVAGLLTKAGIRLKL